MDKDSLYAFLYRILCQTMLLMLQHLLPLIRMPMHAHTHTHPIFLLVVVVVIDDLRVICRFLSVIQYCLILCISSMSVFVYRGVGLRSNVRRIILRSFSHSQVLYVVAGGFIYLAYTEPNANKLKPIIANHALAHCVFNCVCIDIMKKKWRTKRSICRIAKVS